MSEKANEKLSKAKIVLWAIIGAPVVVIFYPLVVAMAYQDADDDIKSTILFIVSNVVIPLGLLAIGFWGVHSCLDDVLFSILLYLVFWWGIGMWCFLGLAILVIALISN